MGQLDRRGAERGGLLDRPPGQAWDFRPGGTFVSDIKDALENSERIIAVYSPNYFHSGFGEDEWTAAFADRSLIPVRVRKCEIPKLLRTRVYIDLVNRDEVAARTALLAGVRKEGVVQRGRLPFPGTAGKAKRFPGALPSVWKVPAPRNPNFTGRDQMLSDLRAGLISGRTLAIIGLGGVGKTHLALEYCYRYCSEYSLVWWTRAGEPAALASDYASLAEKLNLPEKDLDNQTEIIAAVRAWLEQNTGWLLVFDNATGVPSCGDYYPRTAAGHVLVTSQNPVWREIADPLPVKELARSESLAFLRKRSGEDASSEADALSEALGDLPLALEHAGAYIDATAISIGAYVELLGKCPKQMIKPVEKTWALAFEKLQADDAAASDLLKLLAYLESVPRDVLQYAAENAIAFNHSVAALRRYSLIEAGTDVISLHRLVQQVTRERLSEAEQDHWEKAAASLLRSQIETWLGALAGK